MSSRIPHLLEPYVTVPSESSSLILVTSVLGANANWLLLRHLYAALRSEDSNDTGVVLVSFMRDAAFWRESASKLGLDLDAQNKAGRVVLVDGLTGLFTGQQGNAQTKVLRSSKLADVQSGIEAALAELRCGRRVLIVDAPDVLLAASDDDVTSLSVQNMILSLRSSSVVHSTVIGVSADSPLVAAQGTTLEREHASLALSLAHAADAVQAMRLLDTGTARDVSGVVRLTGPLVEEGGREYLYYVAADGAVKVFERGT